VFNVFSGASINAIAGQPRQKSSAISKSGYWQMIPIICSGNLSVEEFQSLVQALLFLNGVNHENSMPKSAIS
jgi:hypothetical protein